MSYHHFSTFERGEIGALLRLGYSTRKIAANLGRHHSSIAREISRNTNIEYSPELAQKTYELRRKDSKSQGKYSSFLENQITEKLKLTWSPEQIVNADTLVNISFKTIYNWINAGKLSLGNKALLRHKGKKRSCEEKRGKFTIGKTIHQRPKEVSDRKVFGHWELDTLVSSRGKSKGCLATFLERKSRNYVAIKMPDRKADSMAQSIRKLLSKIPTAAFKTATVDRGKEFACHKKVYEQLKVSMYFADPYSAWQRGSNENANGLLREFYPKKTDLSLIDEDELMRNLDIINSRPRKCLGWKTPKEVFLYEVSHLI